MANVVKVKVRTPSGKIVVHKKWAKAGVAKCAVCGKELQAIPRLRSFQLRKLPKSKRKPERPFGGYLCSRCMREVFREKTRKLSS
ncbi:MAG: 50S ribosomal protein L34e [Candidatus Aenigmatarchaeota archaeon]